MERRRAVTWLLAAALVWGAGVRVAGNVLKGAITHDESITYLAVTGHERMYSAIVGGVEAPYGAWVPAREWKDLQRIDKPFCFATIARDLAAHDLHPPLYFWILHLWALVFGIHLWTGPALNLMVFALTAAALFRLARETLANDVLAAAAVFLWAAAPSAAQVSLHARPYELMALWTVVLAWRAVVLARRERAPSARDLAVVAAIVAAGMLTHYYFAIVVVVVAAWLWLSLRGRGGVLRIAAAMAAGAAAFVAIHPAFLESVARERAQAQAFAAGGVTTRVLVFLDTVAKFWIHGAAGKWGVYLFTALVPAAIVAAVGRRRGAANRTASAPLFFLSWILVAVAAVYVVHLTPLHAMGPRYMSIAWPFLAFVPVVLIARVSGRRRALLLGAVCAWQAVHGVVFVGNAVYRSPGDPKLAPESPPRAVLVDNVSRGLLPLVVRLLPDDTPVYAARQEYLIEHAGEWADSLAGGIYASHTAYGGSDADRERILELLRARYRVERIPRGLYQFPDAYAIEER